MGKKRRERVGGGQDATDWSSERTLADAEADAAMSSEAEAAASAAGDAANFNFEPLAPGERRLPAIEIGCADAASARCACGSEEFLLEAFLAVIRGKPQPEPVELEALTCPQCGREYEAIWLADGRVARGEYRGQTDLDD